MTLRRSLLAVASVALAIVLIALLIKVGKINLRVTLQQLESVNLVAFAKLVLLTGLHVYLSNMKWRSIDAALRRPSDSVPSRSMSFAFTSIGVALGQLLPVQLSMSGARTLGTYAHGGALKRGTVGTLFEQSFDVLIVSFLAVASVATWFYKGGAMMWTAAAAAMTVFALLAVGPAIRLIRWLAAYGSRMTTSRSRVLRSITGLKHLSIVNAGLARRLMMLSAARFVVQVAMWYQTARAIGAHIPFWQLGAALPFVIATFALSVTPAGLGINEFASVTALKLLGTPLTVGAPWAIASRVLITTSSFVVAIGGVVFLLVVRVVTPDTRSARARERNGPPMENR